MNAEFTDLTIQKRRTSLSLDSDGHADHGRSNETMNPCPEWIHRFI